jgi:hypothetical protein
MQPKSSPFRIRFVPHWQYLYAAKMYRLHLPTGMSSKMFTHLASRSVYIDADLCGGEDWLGHWMAHELGHLATNSPREDDAERAAREYRKLLKDAHKGDPHSSSSNQLFEREEASLRVNDVKSHGSSDRGSNWFCSKGTEMLERSPRLPLAANPGL